VAGGAGHPRPQGGVRVGRRPGALFILGAGFNGASFLNYNEDANSYVMALLFAAAVLCYIVLLALPRSTERQAPAA
jgi:hypothetical protein